MDILVGQDIRLVTLEVIEEDIRAQQQHIIEDHTIQELNIHMHIFT